MARAANVAVIAMSSTPSERGVISAFQAGAIDYLVKPFDEVTTTAKVLGGLAFAKEVLNRTKAFTVKTKVGQEG
ncbi:response regulator, partial [Citrobacter sp. AAK_AS5]